MILRWIFLIVVFFCSDISRKKIFIILDKLIGANRGRKKLIFFFIFFQPNQEKKHVGRRDRVGNKNYIRSQ